MSSEQNNSTPRREFIGQLAASAIVIAGAACAPAAAASSTANPTPAPRPPAPATPHWDDSWFGRLTAKHKAVFDSPEIDEGAGVFQAVAYVTGMRDAIGASETDVQAVLVMRHAGVPMAFNDAMWEKYEIGKETKTKDSTGKWARKNPFLDTSADRPARPGNPDRPRYDLSWLASHGHILLGCDLATRGHAGIIAQRIKGDSRAIYEELKANLVPGVILQPTGVYAVHRAQEAGCTYIRST
ncbi:MAG TPA: hypothetical protein VL383_11795 [Gemmatimonadaceae bacterium]|nr:hypothetical protein [Gemmatimonadaceae bacterium]